MFPSKPKNKKIIYLDHAAATPMEEKVLAAMKPYFLKEYANPSSLYSMGVEARNAIEEARITISQILHTQKDTIIFTSGATEANNLAIFGLARFVKMKHVDTKKKLHIITTKIEHDSVLRPIQQLEHYGFDITYLDVDEYGFVTAEQVKKALRKETILVSIMYANNEIGTIEPVADIGREILKWRKENKTNYPYFHTDAAQAAGALELSVEKLHVDLMTLNGGKIYGPKGTGILYKRRGIQLEPLFLGGRQEFGVRAATENVPGIVGFTKALEVAQVEKEKKNNQIEKLRDYFWVKLEKEVGGVMLNGPTLDCHSEEERRGIFSKNVRGKKDSSLVVTLPPQNDNLSRLPNNLNVSFTGIEGEMLLFYLDAYGIMCSTGSACSTESNEPSHVLMSCGLEKERINGSIRFTLGKSTTKKDIDYVVKILKEVVKELRKLKM